MQKCLPYGVPHKMRTKISCFIFTNILFLCFPLIALPQSETPKYEVGVHAAALRINKPYQRLFGVGGRFTFNVNEMIALEGETTFYDRVGNLTDRHQQVLGGVKVGKRFSNFGLFGKVQTGMLRSRGGTISNAPCFVFNQPENLRVPRCSYQSVGRPDLALGFGGVLEIYPTRRWVIRLDVGDLLTRRRREVFGDISGFPPPGITTVFAGTQVSLQHSLQTTAGIGFRF
jgi:hypothetical protein